MRHWQFIAELNKITSEEDRYGCHSEYSIRVLGTGTSEGGTSWGRGSQGDSRAAAKPESLSW